MSAILYLILLSVNVVTVLSSEKTEFFRKVTLTEESFGLYNGEKVTRFTWTTPSGFSLSAITYGAIITSIKVPNKNGEVADVVMGFDDLESYVTRNTGYFGAILGRCANRIGNNGTFTIDGVLYKLAQNDGNAHLHGGIIGFDKKIWTPTVNGTKVTFSYLSRDGEEGYPGDVIVSVTYDVTEDGTLKMELVATSSKKTVLNLANHSYFNLAGHGTGSEQLYEHIVTINADKITETDDDSIPTGKLMAVRGTAFNLRTATQLRDLLTIKPDLFDDNFCVPQYGEGMTFVARAFHPSSGRYLAVYSDQPGVQFYTANSLPTPEEEAIKGKSDAEYRQHGALCFETQNYPDAVNHQNFPSAILVPGQVYRHRTIYNFGVSA